MFSWAFLVFFAVSLKLIYILNCCSLIYVLKLSLVTSWLHFILSKTLCWQLSAGEFYSVLTLWVQVDDWERTTSTIYTSGRVMPSSFYCLKRMTPLFCITSLRFLHIWWRFNISSQFALFNICWKARTPMTLELTRTDELRCLLFIWESQPNRF